MTLYELTDDLMALIAMMEEDASYDSDEEKIAHENAIMDTIELVATDFSEKCDGYAKVIKQIEADAAAIKAEKMRLAKRQQTVEANLERLKGAVLKAMTTTGQLKIKTDLFTFGTRKSDGLVVDDIFSVPEDFLRYKEPEVMAAEVKKAIKDGAEIPGVHIESRLSLSLK